MLTVSHIFKTFELDDQKIIALEDVNFTVSSGEFFTVVGPSGCGKSTLLRIIAGLEKQDKGTLSWKENPIIGFVFQLFALFPFLTVFENIEFGVKMQGLRKAQRREIVKKLIGEVGLLGFEDKHPRELSGGMKQRVGIARALAVSPSVLLLDEPFSSLDEFTAAALRKLLVELFRKRKITVIMITHRIEEAVELSDSIAVMTSSPGQVSRVFKDSLKRPRNPRSPEFFKLEDDIKKLIKL